MPESKIRLSAPWVLPLETNQDHWLDDHSVLIESGQITAIVPNAQAERDYSDYRHYSYPGHVLMPGLINAHTHAAMNLLRGFADDLPVLTWLQEHIWPAEGRLLSDQFVFQGTQLAIAEFLRGGITCFNDQYMFPAATARAAEQAKIRALIDITVIDVPTAWAQNGAEGLAKGLAELSEFADSDYVNISLGPHAPYTVNDDLLKQIRALSEQHQWRVHMHLHESEAEIQGSLETYGCRPLQRIADLGLLNERFIGVHMCCLTDQDLDLITDTQLSIACCTESNLKLASGLFPFQAALERGINLALGTDGAASNNDLDMFSELRTTAQLAKVLANDARVLPAAQALYMATLGGAKALGLDQQIGSLTPGKQADIIAVDLDSLDCLPVYNPISTLAYATGRHQVTDVWVGAERLLANRQLCTLDETELKTNSHYWQQQISARS